MKITRMHLRKIIQESMYDVRTLPKDNIPRGMIAIDNDDFKDKLAMLSTDEMGYNQSLEMIDDLAGTPAVIDLAGGYQGALKKADRMKTHALFNDIKHFIHNIYPTLSSAYVPYNDYIRRRYREGTLMSQDDIIDNILNISPEAFFESMWYYYLTDRGHEDPIYDDSNNYKKYDDYLKLIEKELRKFYTADRIKKIAIGEL